jgi:hypothetical protein
MRKKGLIKLLAILIIVLVVGFFFFMKNFNTEEPECKKDNDCVAGRCCHADFCVSIKDKPDCTGAMCTEECIPNTLDCSQGRCKCQEGKCKAEIE